MLQESKEKTNLFSSRSHSPPAPLPPATVYEKVTSIEVAFRIPRACRRSYSVDLASCWPFHRALPNSPSRGCSPRYPPSPTSFPKSGRGQLLKVPRCDTPLKNIHRYNATRANYSEKDSPRKFRLADLPFYFYGARINETVYGSF